jgi:pimeloyl-ACP methyl ester carboxylesterase
MTGRRGSEGRRGRLGNGMEHLTWGDGPRSLLFLPGGPGSGLPAGLSARMSRRWFEPFLEAGYTVWYVTRCRDMPSGHTVADMADDYAAAIDEALGGRADLVVGESYGGMVGLHLAASHPDSLEHLAVVIAAAVVSEDCRQVDEKLVAALARGDLTSAGAAFTEYAVAGERGRWVRRALGHWVGRHMLSGAGYPPSDVMVEAEAEMTFDARPVLPAIEAPVLMVCGDRDRFFPRAAVEETAALIPDCTLVWHPGKGHMQVGGSREVPRQVLEFVARRG